MRKNPESPAGFVGTRRMSEPIIKTEMFGRDRYVTVLFPLDETTSEYVSAWFIDAGTPEEPRAAERERLIDRARALLRKVGRPPRSA
jgi:hypothetical protein